MSDLSRYFAAHIRIHTGRSTQGWSDEEIMDSACMLPSPALRFDEWASLISALSGAENTESAPDIITEADEHEANARWLQSMRAAARKFPDEIKIKKVA